MKFCREAASPIEKSTADVPAMVDCLRHHGVNVLYSLLGSRFVKALILGSIHHFCDPTSMFKKWTEWLRPGSVCFILTRPPTSTLPFFRKAASLFEKSPADVPAMVDCLRHHGCKVEVSEEKMMFK